MCLLEKILLDVVDGMLLHGNEDFTLRLSRLVVDF
jgi:hypothetical protein